MISFAPLPDCVCCLQASLSSMDGEVSGAVNGMFDSIEEASGLVSGAFDDVIEQVSKDLDSVTLTLVS